MKVGNQAVPDNVVLRFERIKDPSVKDLRLEYIWPVFSLWERKKNTVVPTWIYAGRLGMENLIAWLDEAVMAKTYSYSDYIQYIFDGKGNHCNIPLGWFCNRWAKIINKHKASGPQVETCTVIE